MLGEQLARLQKFKTVPQQVIRPVSDEMLYYSVLPLAPTKLGEFADTFSAAINSYARNKFFTDKEYEFMANVVARHQRNGEVCEMMLEALERGASKGEEKFFTSLLCFYEEKGFFTPRQLVAIEKNFPKK
jgi:hypothetical protein